MSGWAPHPGGGYPPGPGGYPGPQYPDAGPPGGGKSKTGLFLGIGGGVLAVIVLAVVGVVVLRGGGGHTLVAADTAGGLKRDKAYEQKLKQRSKQAARQNPNAPKRLDMDGLITKTNEEAPPGARIDGSVSAYYRMGTKSPLTGKPERLTFLGLYGKFVDPQKIVDDMFKKPSSPNRTVKPVDTGELGGVAACSHKMRPDLTK